MSSAPEILAEHVVALAWIRCVQEEGVNFKNKRTGQVERDEKVIFDAFQKNLGHFDLPAAKGSKQGLEKNILEILGGYLLQTSDNSVLQVLFSQTFRSLIQNKIDGIRERPVG